LYHRSPDARDFVFCNLYQKDCIPEAKLGRKCDMSVFKIIIYCFSGTRARDKETTPAATSLGDFLSRPVTFPSKII
jgi:hypothetical protein